MYINKSIIRFSNHLNLTFNNIIDIATNEMNQLDDFTPYQLETGYLQFMWEILVERFICNESEELMTYGEGADFFVFSERVISNKSNVVKSRYVLVEVDNAFDYLSNTHIKSCDLLFSKLVSFVDGQYEIKPPFNYVLCEDSDFKQFIFDMSSVNFVKCSPYHSSFLDLTKRINKA